MLQRVAALPPDTLVLVGFYFKDRTGRSFVPFEVAAEIGRRANAPVLSLYETLVSQGLTGGSVLSAQSLGRRAGEIGFELLTGARRPDQADAEATVLPQPMFDWTQLKRWGADPARLPEGTLFLNRPRTLWNDYRDTVIIAGAALLFLSALLVALLLVNHRHKQLQLTLRGSELRYRQLTENLVDVIFSVGHDGRYTFMSPSIQEMTGFTVAEAMALSPADLLTPESLGIVGPYLEQSLAAGLAGLPVERFRAELEAYRKDGSTFMTEVTASAHYLQDGSFGGVLGVVRDISERKTAEERLRMAAEGAQFGVIELDFVAGSTYWSKEFRQMMGIGADYLVPPPGQIPDFIHPDDMQALQARVRKAMTEGVDGDFIADLFRIVRPDGEVRWISLRGHLQYAGSGANRQLLRLHAVTLDVTAEKTAELALQASRDQLEQTVAERTRDLQQAYNRLSEVMFALESVGTAIYWIDPQDARILSANAHASRMLGYSMDEFSRLKVTDINRGFTLEKFRQIHETIRAQGSMRLETEHRRKDGTVVPVEVSLYAQLASEGGRSGGSPSRSTSVNARPPSRPCAKPRQRPSRPCAPSRISWPT